MKTPVSLRTLLRNNVLKQALLGGGVMIVVLIAITYFLGRYKAASDLEATGRGLAKAFRAQIVEGDIKIAELQIAEILKTQKTESVIILDTKMNPIYRRTEQARLLPKCKLIGTACLPNLSGAAEVLMPIYYNEEQPLVFGYLYIKRDVNLDWVFLGLVSVVFALGYLTVLSGVTRMTASSMKMFAQDLENWSNRLSQDPKNAESLSETPFQELVPLRTAIEGLNQRIGEYEATAAKEAKFLILRGIAHDLLGPVSQAQLYLATLRKKAESEPGYSLLISKALDSVKAVADVASQVKMLKQSPDLNEYIDFAVETKIELEIIKRSDVIKDKRLFVMFENRDAGFIEASTSRPELKRILQNLVGNAADASADGSRIEVKVAHDGEHAILTVRDFGHGIPLHLQEKVFQPEFTLKAGTGTGLGLSIVRHIVEARNGSVELSSSGDGTLVRVKFPIHRTEEMLNAVL